MRPADTDLSRTSALLIGATSGIGLESAAQFAEAGAPRIMINGRNEDRGRNAVDQIRKRAPEAEVVFFAGDASQRNCAQALAAEASQRFGGVDVLVNAVPGVSAPAPFLDLDPDDFPALIAAHLYSVFFATHAVLPQMIERGGGVVVNISSDAAKIPTPGESVHGALMAAIEMFSRTLALEYARKGVRVHALTPSIVAETYSYERMMDGGFAEKIFTKAVERAALGVATPRDIAPMIVYLASPAAAKMTGQSITINGGIAVA